MVARLDRKRLGQELWQRSGTRSEAFSISRLGGSRWRLRRTRCAMGFECQLAAEPAFEAAMLNDWYFWQSSFRSRSTRSKVRWRGSPSY